MPDKACGVLALVALLASACGRAERDPELEHEPPSGGEAGAGACLLGERCGDECCSPGSTCVAGGCLISDPCFNPCSTCAPPGASCGPGFECRDGTCTDMDAECNAVCSSSEHCEVGEICAGGVCVIPHGPCAEDTSCPDELYCCQGDCGWSGAAGPADPVCIKVCGDAMLPPAPVPEQPCALADLTCSLSSDTEPCHQVDGVTTFEARVCNRGAVAASDVVADVYVDDGTSASAVFVCQALASQSIEPETCANVSCTSDVARQESFELSVVVNPDGPVTARIPECNRENNTSVIMVTACGS